MLCHFPSAWVTGRQIWGIIYNIYSEEMKENEIDIAKEAQVKCFFQISATEKRILDGVCWQCQQQYAGVRVVIGHC